MSMVPFKHCPFCIVASSAFAVYMLQHSFRTFWWIDVDSIKSGGDAANAKVHTRGICSLFQPVYRYSNEHQTPGYIYSPPKQVYISLPISQNRVSA